MSFDTPTGHLLSICSVWPEATQRHLSLPSPSSSSLRLSLLVLRLHDDNPRHPTTVLSALLFHLLVNRPPTDRIVGPL
jgi:hypothetical protein